MKDEQRPDEEVEPSELDQLGRDSLLSEFTQFLVECRKWWMIPIVVVFVLFALLLVLIAVNPGLVPFLYALW
jgi:hypothetical protein